MPFSTSRPPGSIIKLGGDLRLVLLGGKLQISILPLEIGKLGEGWGVWWKRNSFPIIHSSISQMQQILWESFENGVCIQNLCQGCGCLVLTFLSLSLAKQRISTELRIATCLQRANCLIYSIIPRTLYKRNYKLKQKVVLTLEGNTRFLKTFWSVFRSLPFKDNSQNLRYFLWLISHSVHPFLQVWNN